MSKQRQPAWYIVILHLRSLLIFISLVGTMERHLVRQHSVLTKQYPGSSPTRSCFITSRWRWGSALGKVNAMAVLTVIGIFVVLIPFLFTTYRQQRRSADGKRTRGPGCARRANYRPPRTQDGSRHPQALADRRHPCAPHRVGALQRTAVLWAVLTSIKKPVEANSRTPKILGFQPTSGNYAELWLNMPAWDFAPYGIGLLALIALLVVVGIASKRWRVSRTAVYVGIVAALVPAALVLPNLANMAEFYGYFLNSIIVTVGTLVISISIGAWDMVLRHIPAS